MNEICKSRIMATPQAKNFMELHGLNLEDCLFFLDMKNRDIDFLMEKLIEDAKSKSGIKDTDDIHNWNSSPLFILRDMDIWFITEENIGEEVEVFDRFNRKMVKFRIPSTHYVNVGSLNNPNETPLADTPDYLAFYNYNTGCIVIVTDRILSLKNKLGLNESDVKVLFKKVVLHELIHACLDLSPRGSDGRIQGSKVRWISNDKRFSEESIDNAIILKCYKKNPQKEIVHAIIKSQPELYQSAFLLDSNEEIKKYLKELIKYKNGIETTPRYVVGNKSFPKIGRAAYEILKRIVEKEKFGDITAPSHPLSKYVAGPSYVAGLDSWRKNNFYRNAVLTADGYELKITSVWKDKNFELLSDIVSQYLDVFKDGGLTII